MFFCQTSTSVNFSSNFPRLFGHRLPYSSCSFSSFRRLHRRSRRSYEHHLCRESWSRQHPGHTWTHVSLGTLGKSSMTVELTETLDTIFIYHSSSRHLIAFSTSHLFTLSPSHLFAFSPSQLLTFHLLAFSTSHLFTLSPFHLLTFQVPSHWPLDTSHSPHTGTSQVKQYFLKKSKVTVGGEYSILMT